MSPYITASSCEAWSTLSALWTRVWASFLLLLHEDSPHGLLPFTLMPSVRVNPPLLL